MAHFSSARCYTPASRPLGRTVLSREIPDPIRSDQAAWRTTTMRRFLVARTVLRRFFVGCVCVCASALWQVPAAWAEIQVGAAVRVITPDPLLPVSGGMGTPNPSREKRGRAHGPGDRLSQRRGLRRGRGARSARVSVGAGRSRACESDPHSGQEHPHRLDSHPQRSRLLRLSRRQRGTYGRPQVHGLRLRQGRRGGQRGDRPPPAGLRSRSRPARPRGKSPTTTTPPTCTTGG